MKTIRHSIPFLLTSCGALSLLGYIAMSSPGHLVVSPRGEIIGITNVARATLQGRRFWDEQARQAKIELDWNLATPQREAEINARIDELIARTDQGLNQFYEQYPKEREAISC